MQSGEIYLVFTEPLVRLGLKYMVTGSVASSSYGEPRFTHDIDLIVSMRLDRIEQLSAAFPLEGFDCLPAETLRTEAVREKGGQFNLVHHETGFKADIYVSGSDELTDWAFENRRRIEILPGRSIDLAPPEYVILGKLEFYKEGGGERHIRDIRSMLKVEGESFDHDFLQNWIRELKVGSVWSVVEQA